MGKQARANAIQKKNRSEIPTRVFKALINVVVLIPLLLLYAIREGYVVNDWLWKDFDWKDPK